ncbi:MAG TPA: TMEM175 family protein [Gaiellales bacterium]
MLGDGADLESGAADRLLFFSDAVVAIALTLLALELPVPDGKTTGAFWHSVQRYDGNYSAFLISFVVIAAAWGQHHHVMRFAERSDARLRTLDMLWLLTIVLNPFATKLLTTEGHDSLATHALRFGFYALLQVLASGAFIAMVRHMVARGLQSPLTPPRIASEASWQGIGVIAGFGLSIPVFFVTRDAWLLWIAGPVIAGQVMRRDRRRAAADRPR